MVVRDSLEREIHGLFEGSTLIFTCGAAENTQPLLQDNL